MASDKAKEKETFPSPEQVYTQRELPECFRQTFPQPKSKVLAVHSCGRTGSKTHILLLQFSLFINLKFLSFGASCIKFLRYRLRLPAIEVLCDFTVSTLGTNIKKKPQKLIFSVCFLFYCLEIINIWFLCQFWSPNCSSNMNAYNSIVFL